MAERPSTGAASVAPYGSGEVQATSATEWRVVFALRRAYNARLLTLRLKGAGLDYRVVADGVAGAESVTAAATGVNTTTRIALPELLAAPRVELQVKLTAAGNPVTAIAEASWIPLGPGPELERR